jgi:UDP-galactopyranose mutase
MDIVCFSHLRWNFVYQRPQHLLSRMALHFRTFFYEEPIFDAAEPYYEITTTEEDVIVVVPHLGADANPENIILEQQQLFSKLARDHAINKFIAWIYSPVMIDVLGDLKPSLTVYDCMDELSNFKNAPPSLAAKETVLFSIADIVFTGGRSLYESKKSKHHNVHLFPSSIDRDHFINGRKQQPDPDDQKTIPRPRIGFFGVIDERMDISLLDAIAAGKPRWSFIILGPVVKIDPGTLPRQPNIFYLGSKSYKELPAYLAGWDVAMMPFALNDATKFISPTKTPEFLAAGKPVVSTAITDVVTMYGEEGLVHIAGTPGEFIEGIEKGLELKENLQWLKAVDRCIGKSSWDETASKMLFIINTCLEKKGSDTVKKKKLYV